jgi:hypothetical protein
MTTKAGLLEQLDKTVATWEELAEAALREDVNRPGAMGDWTFVDVSGHLNGWRARSVSRMEAGANGTEPSQPWPEDLSDATDEGTDAINDWIYERYHDRPIEEILDEAREQWRRLRAAAEAIPEPDLLAPGRYPWLGGYALGEVINGATAHFHEEHEADIRNWLRRET